MTICSLLRSKRKHYFGFIIFYYQVIRLTFSRKILAPDDFLDLLLREDASADWAIHGVESFQTISAEGMSAWKDAHSSIAIVESQCAYFAMHSGVSRFYID